MSNKNLTSPQDSTSFSDPLSNPPTTPAYLNIHIRILEDRLHALEIKTYEGWLNSFQAREIGKLTSQISELQGRVLELEKKQDNDSIREFCYPSNSQSTDSLTKTGIVVDYNKLNCIVEMDTIVVNTLVNIQQASKNLLDHLQQTGGISFALLKKLWDSLGYDDNPPRITSIHP